MLNIDKKPNDSSVFSDRSILCRGYRPSSIKDIRHRDEQIKEMMSVFERIVYGITDDPVFLKGSPGSGKTIITIQLVNELKKSIEDDVAFIIFDNGRLHPSAGVSDSAILKSIIKDMERHLGSTLDMPSKSISDLVTKFTELCRLHAGPIIILIKNIEYIKNPSVIPILYRNMKELEGITNVQFIYSTYLFPTKNDGFGSISSDYRKTILFPPYSSTELFDILSEKAKKAFKHNAISEDALKLCAAYASQEDGNARNAIDLLYKAGLEADYNNSPTVKPEHVTTAYMNTKNGIITHIISMLPVQQILLLISTYLAEKLSSPFSKEELGFSSPSTSFIYKIYEKVSEYAEYETLSQRRVADIFSMLQELGLVHKKQIRREKAGLRVEVSLPISEDQLISSLKIFPNISSICNTEKMITVLQPTIQEWIEQQK
jgi:cell division control protein 6